MATGTVMPSPYQSVLDDAGVSVPAATITVYLAGTTTPTNTYTDSALTVANSNPIVADSAGRFVAYLTPGISFKFLYKTAAGATIKTVDNVTAVPSSSANLDILGTAGEALTAGQVVYMSDGSGGKTAGQWYKADADFTYASTTPIIGFAVADIAIATSGTIRDGGIATGLTGLTVGTTYYISTTAGAVTSTAPSNARVVGVADTTTSIVMGIPAGFSSTTLLYANSGTNTSATAANVDTYAMASQLTVKDTLLVIVELASITQTTATPLLVNVTDSNLTVMDLMDTASLTAGNYTRSVTNIGVDQSGAILVRALTTWTAGSNATNARAAAASIGWQSTFTTPYTGAWTIGLRHGGVTAGGTLQYRWQILLLRGQ